MYWLAITGIIIGAIGVLFLTYGLRQDGSWGKGNGGVLPAIFGTILLGVGVAILFIDMLVRIYT